MEESSVHILVKLSTLVPSVSFTRLKRWELDRNGLYFLTSELLSPPQSDQHTADQWGHSNWRILGSPCSPCILGLLGAHLMLFLDILSSGDPHDQLSWFFL